MTEQETVENPEFMYLPLESIIVEEQIRSRINAEGESFNALMESIKERGVINSGKRGSRGRGFEGSSENKICSQFTVHGSRQSSIRTVYYDVLSPLCFSPTSHLPIFATSALQPLRLSSHGSGERHIGIYSGTTSR